MTYVDHSPRKKRVSGMVIDSKKRKYTEQVIVGERRSWIRESPVPRTTEGVISADVRSSREIDTHS